jgi:predicted nucleic acid-binding protein
MCIIVDANAASELVQVSEDGLPIVERLRKGDLRMVSGHKLKTELLKTNVKSIYQELVLGGRIVEFSDAQIEDEIVKVKKFRLHSNDPHILALARVSGARILFSRDGDLHSDFKNSKVIRPKGKVYQSRKHQKLLDEVPCKCD